MSKFAPYFFDGYLHLPKTTLDALIPHGLDLKTARSVRDGVDLTDSATMETLIRAVHTYIEAAPDSPITDAILNSQAGVVLSGNFPIPSFPGA